MDQLNLKSHHEFGFIQTSLVERRPSLKRQTIILTYSTLADGGYLRLELITSKSTIQGAEQMTFTRGRPRHLITHFHKVAGLLCQADTTHKQWRNNNMRNLFKKSNKTGKGDEMFRVTFYTVKTH